MDKMFTAVAVMQLVEQGKLRLDAPIGMYLRNYPNDALASKVTVHQLLTHTGGTGDIFGPGFNAHRLDLRQPSDYVALYGKRAAESGGRFSYSNYGYVLLGAAIESASGQGYYDYVREHVLLPAGMHKTESIAVDKLGRSCAVGYSLADGQWRSNKETLPYRGSPAGGGYSTVSDLLRFARALLARRLLNDEHTTLATTERVRADDGAYGYGFRLFDEGGVIYFGHGGGTRGINTELRIYPKSGYIVVVLANRDPPAARSLGKFIGARLPAN